MVTQQLSIIVEIIIFIHLSIIIYNSIEFNQWAFYSYKTAFKIKSSIEF